MKKSLAAVLLMGLALSASAENLGHRGETQKLQFYFTPYPYSPANFYCDVQPTVSYVSFKLNNAKVTGFGESGKTFIDTVSNLLNHVYFTGSYVTFTGSPALIEVEYEGLKDDVACYNGQGNRTIEYN